MKSMILRLIAMGLLAGPIAADADQIFDFSGTCTVGCTGTATAVLDLTDYALGTSITASEFVSFTYNSSDIFVPAWIPSQLGSISGCLDATGQCAPVLKVCDAVGTCNGVQFETIDVPDTVWSFTYLGVLKDEGTGAIGPAAAPSFTWTEASDSTSVPEPATILLLGLGLAGVGFMRRRKAG